MAVEALVEKSDAQAATGQGVKARFYERRLEPVAGIGLWSPSQTPIKSHISLGIQGYLRELATIFHPTVSAFTDSFTDSAWDGGHDGGLSEAMGQSGLARVESVKPGLGISLKSLEDERRISQSRGENP